MIAKVIGAVKDAFESKDKIIFELRQNNNDIFFVASNLDNHRPLYQMKLEYTDKKELCDQIFFAITSKVIENPSVNFIDHLCCGFGDTRHTDILIELSENIALCIFDKDCNFQDWILEMKNKSDNKAEEKVKGK